MSNRKPIPARLRHEVFQRDGYRCRECGATNKETSLEIDHIIPVSKGGTNDLSNLQTLCKKCNRAKHTRTWVGGNKENTVIRKRDMRVCPKCGKNISSYALFCGYCNYKLPNSKTRRTYSSYRPIPKVRQLSNEGRVKLREDKLEKRFGFKFCPSCGEKIYSNALRCKYCHYMFEFNPYDKINDEKHDIEQKKEISYEELNQFDTAFLNELRLIFLPPGLNSKDEIIEYLFDNFTIDQIENMVNATKKKIKNKKNNKKINYNQNTNKITQKNDITNKSHEIEHERCPYCGINISPGDNFCTNCGIKLEPSEIKNNVSDPKLLAQGFRKCPKCGHKIKKDIYPCPFCESRENPHKNRNRTINSNRNVNINRNKQKNGVQYIINEINKEKTENNDETKFCHECGAKINPELHYCQNCGINHPPHILDIVDTEKNKYQKNNYISQNKNSENIQNNVKNDKRELKTQNNYIKEKSTKNDKLSIREFINLYIKAPIKEKTIVTFYFIILLLLIITYPPIGLSIIAIGTICYLLNKLDILKLN